MISTHILDTTSGSPADQVKVRLERETPQGWTEISTMATNADGRIQFNNPAEAGNYRLTFYIEDYFKRRGQEHFFLNTPISFRVKDIQRKYHVPLLLNPYGYSSYRGS